MKKVKSLAVKRVRKPPKAKIKIAWFKVQEVSVPCNNKKQLEEEVRCQMRGGFPPGSTGFKAFLIEDRWGERNRSVRVQDMIQDLVEEMNTEALTDELEEMRGW